MRHDLFVLTLAQRAVRHWKEGVTWRLWVAYGCPEINL